MEKLTHQEEEIMLVIWKKKRGIIKDFLEQLPEPQPPYTTVASIVKNLEKKGFLSSEKIGNTYLYIPRITQTEYKKKFLSGIVKSYFSNSYKEMVTFFAHEQKLSEEDLRQIIEMIERGKSYPIKTENMAFLLYLLQINIALSLLYLCYKVLFSQNTFFGLRRLILISIVLFSTTYPWYDIPDIDPIIPAHLQITLPEVLYSMEETVPQKAFDIYPLIAYLYGGICSLFLLRMFLRIASIIKLRANGKLRIIGESHIIVCDENIQPCSFFRWIFLPHSILQNKNTLTRILRHENTHIRQLHTIDVLLGESMAALCWINPLSWLLLKEIRLNLEYMADEAAIPDEQEKKTYQYLLLDISQSNNELPSAIPFNYSFLKTRIRMINRKRSQTTSVFKYLLILPLFLAIVTANQCCTDQQPLQSEIEKVFPKPSEVQTKDSSTTASETSETPLEVAEIMPEFPGGTEALLSFIKDNLEYPQKAIDEQTEGRVIIRFVVNSNGEISDPTILKGINKNLDQAAIDVINKLPRWKPGQQDGQPVSVQFTLPIVFKLT